MWSVKKINNWVNIERRLFEDGQVIAYELAGYISSDGSFNPVTGRRIPDSVLSDARALM